MALLVLHRTPRNTAAKLGAAYRYRLSAVLLTPDDDASFVTRGLARLNLKQSSEFLNSENCPILTIRASMSQSYWRQALPRQPTLPIADHGSQFVIPEQRHSAILRQSLGRLTSKHGPIPRFHASVCQSSWHYPLPCQPTLRIADCRFEFVVPEQSPSSLAQLRFEVSLSMPTCNRSSSRVR